MMFPAVLLIVALCASGCTITVTPITKTKKPKTKYYQTSSKKKSSTKRRTSDTIVDHEWLVEYRRLESEHGDYTISDDYKVESVGGGKYRVTRAMLSHFRDLSQAPPPK